MLNERLTEVFLIVRPALNGGKNLTAKEIGVRAVDMFLLEQEKLVERVDVVRTGKRGRPPIVWALTITGERWVA